MPRSARLDRIAVIAKREYVSRVKTKGFWIGTLVLPIFMLAMAFLPGLFLSKTQSELRLVVVDASGKVGTPLVERLSEGGRGKGAAAAAATKAGDTPDVESIQRQAEAQPGLASRLKVVNEPLAADGAAQRADLDRRVLEEKLDAWLWIPADILESNRAEYHGESVSNLVTQEILEVRLSRVVRSIRFAEAGLDAAQVEKLSTDVDLESMRVTKEGGQQESRFAGFFVPYILFFLLFITIMIYGQQILTGVLEEKSSRIVEVLISAVKPFELLMGKLLGIAGVGLTQLGIWLGTAILVTSAGFVAALPFLAAAGINVPSISPALLPHLLGFFVLGFLLYASYFAAMGSAFNNLQEAQQTAGALNTLLFVPFLGFFVIVADPDSTASVVLSLFPPFTPLLMAARIAVKMPPFWQIALGYLGSIAAVVGMVWLCGKIYRVGILMYGKKPTLPEIWKWLRYA
jgi:ABC-2 type transport system permease protein